MGNFETKLKKLIHPICEEEKILLEEISVLGRGNKVLVKIIVDTESGITLSQCQELSKRISDVFYRKDVFSGGYHLEVSSPGTSKPLDKAFEFRRSVGKELQVIFRDEDEIKSITGELIGFDGEEITLQSKNKDICILLSDIEEAKIKLKW